MYHFKSGHSVASPLWSCHAAFTSDRSGEVCVFWAPRCGTGFDHPAKATQNSCRKIPFTHFSFSFHKVSIKALLFIFGFVLPSALSILRLITKTRKHHCIISLPRLPLHFGRDSERPKWITPLATSQTFQSCINKKSSGWTLDYSVVRTEK